MTDNDLVDQICAKIDTLSETGAREVIRMVRDHDRDQYAEERRASIRAGARRCPQRFKLER